MSSKKKNFLCVSSPRAKHILYVYGLLPIVLFPKLTDETKVNWTYLYCMIRLAELAGTIAGSSKEGGAGLLHTRHRQDIDKT